MVGFAHVILHLTLCPSAANLPPSTSIPIAMHMNDATGRQTLDRTFTVTRGEAMQRLLDFDAPRGTFRVRILAPTIRCSAQDYWALISEQNRNIQEQLVNGPAPEPRMMLFEGTAPSSFLYLNPTFVLLDKSTACNAPVNDPPSTQEMIEDDDSSYYVSMPSNPLLDAPGLAVLALQLATPTGEYHYVRVKTPFLKPWDGYPVTFQMNISDDTVDWLSTQPQDVLLCPRLNMTSVG